MSRSPKGRVKENLKQPTAASQDFDGQLQSVLDQPPADLEKMMPMMQQWAGVNGVFSDWHKNCIIIDLLSSIYYTRNVQIELNMEARYFKCIIYISRWRVIFPFLKYWMSKQSLFTKLLNVPTWPVRYIWDLLTYKKQMVTRVTEVIHSYVPNYNSDLEIRYGKNE